MYGLLLAVAVVRGVWGGARRRALVMSGGRAVAVCWADGRHDDTRHLQRAIDDAGSVRLPAGRFRIERALELTSRG